MKSGLIFTIGAVVGGGLGGGITYIFMRKRYDKIVADDIADYKAKKNKEVYEQVKKLQEAEGEFKKEVLDSLVLKYSSIRKPGTSEEKDKTSKVVGDTKPKKYTEYGSYYKSDEAHILPLSKTTLADDFSDYKESNDISEEDMDAGGPPEGDDSDTFGDEMDRLNFEKKEAAKKGIEIVTEEEFEENNGYDKKEYYYYLQSETLTDENDEPVDSFIDTLDNKWCDVADSGRDVYVRNNIFACDYLITTIDGSYYGD